ncbi:MAG: ATP-binding cassette domain-containing protein [Pseudomonadota bacterium]
MPGLEVTNLVKRFGERTVVNNVSLEVGNEEFVAFLGPSGCGKSTLLRMIAGLETPDEGEIRIAGRRVNEVTPGQRGVAMVFQHYALYPHMSVRENMAFGLQNARVAAGEITQRVDKAAALLEIGALLDRKPGMLSGGERQRVAIGRAIVKQPKLFLFDEPMSNLDAALRLRTRLELAQLRQSVKAAMIFVTHDQIEAMTLADRIVVMSHKGVEQVGAPIEVYSRPATIFVAEFVGTPKISLLPVEIAPSDEASARVRLSNGVMLGTQVPAAQLPAAKSCQLGLRADAVKITSAGQGDVDAIVDVVERLGDRSHIYTRTPDGMRVIAESAGSSTLRHGESIGLKFDGAAAYIFDGAGRGYHAAD